MRSLCGTQITGEPLTRRSDDTVDKLRSRLKAFHKQTQPVIEHYDRLGKTVNIDASRDMKASRNFLLLFGIATHDSRFPIMEPS